MHSVTFVLRAETRRATHALAIETAESLLSGLIHAKKQEDFGTPRLMATELLKLLAQLHSEAEPGIAGTRNRSHSPPAGGEFDGDSGQGAAFPCGD